MLYDVYELGEDWRTPDLIKVLQVGPVVADLRITRRFPNSSSTEREGRFFRQGTRTQMFHTLQHVEIVAMGADSVLVVGTVFIAERQTAKSRVNKHRIGYLCKPPGSPVTVRPKPRPLRVSEGGKRVPSSYDPADDDFVDPITYGPLDPSVSR